MKLDILILKDDLEVIHKSTSTVDEGTNPYNVAIQAMINALTGHVDKPVVRAKVSDKFAEAVPAYKGPEAMPEEFHPDLVKEGIAPKIPTIKLDMKTIMKGK